MFTEDDREYAGESNLPTETYIEVCLTQMVMLVLSIIINSTLFVYFIQKKKHEKTFHLAYLNQAGSDILQAVFSTTITLPGKYLNNNLRQLGNVAKHG